MSYFDHHQPQQPYQPTFRQAPLPDGEDAALAYPVDEDGDRIYTEDDYGLPADGDAFRPDEEDDAALWAADPFAAQTPMTYHGSYETTAAMEDWDAEELPDEALLTEEEQAELRRSNWRLLASLADFGGIILGTAAILILVALLISLINWLINDVSQTFTLLQMPF